MSKRYHVTSKNNRASICKEGLVPRFGFLSDLVLEQRRAVYMFNEISEVEYAMKHWFGDNIRYVYDVKNLILLEINLPDNFVTEERFGWESISYSTISPEYITIIDFPRSH